MPLETGTLLQNQVTVLQGEMRETRKNVDILSAHQAEHYRTLLNKIQSLATGLQEINRTTKTQDADLGIQLERMLQDIQELRGAVEVNEHRLGEAQVKIEKTLAERLDTLRQQIARVETSRATPVAKLPKNPKGALLYAKRLLKGKHTEDARMAFRKIVEIWPHELGVTDEAYIYLGDSYLAEKKYEAALRAYIPIIDKLSRSKFIDNAYYKIGLCSMELNRLSDGSTFFNEVIHNHRHSPFVRSAKAKLEAIRVLQQKLKAKGAQTAPVEDANSPARKNSEKTEPKTESKAEPKKEPKAVPASSSTGKPQSRREKRAKKLVFMASFSVYCHANSPN